MSRSGKGSGRGGVRNVRLVAQPGRRTMGPAEGYHMSARREQWRRDFKVRWITIERGKGVGEKRTVAAMG